ncbi:unnamed protein product [Trichogramma brassicae]|uniref:Uncharacterized protein n=1 Tax=Trichogramma brassicae TaxID=86971 RepID=A0A6H5IXQ2_9HYME|nr:unnamed protein product [Trichogramma brassicae]
MSIMDIMSIMNIMSIMDKMSIIDEMSIMDAMSIMRKVSIMNKMLIMHKVSIMNKMLIMHKVSIMDKMSIIAIMSIFSKNCCIFDEMAISDNPDFKPTKWTTMNAASPTNYGEFSRFVFSPGVVEPVPEVERVPLKKKDPGYVISLRSGKKTPITVRAGRDRITISRSPRRGLTRLAIDGAQHSHDEVRSENHTHKRAQDAGAKAQLERMMAPEARTTLKR